MNYRNGFYNIHNTVEMIRHDHGGAQLNLRVARRQRIPDLPDDPTGGIQVHFAVEDFTEQACASASDERNEIRAGLRVIVIRQPYRAAASGGIKLLACQISSPYE